MKKLLFILLAFIGVSPVLKAQTVIMGKAPGAEGKIVKLTTPGDLITFWETPLAETRADSSGNFTLSARLTETRYVTLSIQFHTTELFVEPGKTYTLSISPLNYDESRDINPYIHAQSLQVEIVQPEPDDLNIMIGDFNGQYNAFVLKNFTSLYQERDKSKLDSLRDQVYRTFGNVQNPYFRACVDYKLASLVQLTQSMNQYQLARKYFDGKPILYANIEYMEFFNSFFSKYLTATSKSLKYTDYQKILKGPEPYQNLMKLMGKDTLLKDPQLRDLVLIKGLLELYNTTGYERETVLEAVRAAANLSPYLENREIAANMVKYLTKLMPGTDAPPFTLPDRDQKSVSLKSFEGKPVLISYWTTYCLGCLGEMDLMASLYEKYGDRISFISVAADREFMKMVLFINLKPEYKWTFLHAGDHLEVLKDYNVRMYPMFVLIDKQGKIFRYPADYPSKGLEHSLDLMLAE